jgi:peptide/nickel transport system permease protein
MIGTRYIGARLVQLVLVLIGITIATFLLIHIVPGNPARTLLGVHATPHAVAELDRQFGLDKSLPAQFVAYIGRVLHGNLGTSYYYGSPVGGLIGRALPVTLALIAMGTAIGILLAVPLALLAATHQGKLSDHLVRVVPLVGLGMPPFWIGFVLLILLALGLHVFPAGGYGHTFSAHFTSLILPGLTVAAAMTPVLARSMRASLIEILDSDYVRSATAKGISRRRVLIRHGLRNALVPTLSVLSVNVATLIGGTVVIENVFALPGLGSLLLTGIFNRDFQIVQSATLVYAVIVVTINLLTDLAYGLLDPRVVLGE